MTKAEHYARIIASVKAHEEHPAGLTAIDALAAELAALWAIVEHYAPGHGGPLSAALRRGELAEAALAEALRERDEDAANARRSLDIRDALLVTIADRQRDACAAECRASVLPDAEIFTNLVLGTPLESSSVTEPPFGEANPLAEVERQRAKIQRGALVGVRNAVTSQVEAIREAEAHAVKTLEFIDSILSETD